MSRPPAALLIALVVLTSCRTSNQNKKEEVEAAILHRLQASTGLDLKSLDVTTTSVTFDRNLAYATVAFHPKSDPSIVNGMTMKYTLQNRDGKWAVVSVADSQGHGLAGHTAAAQQDLPPGHPSVDGSVPNPHGPSR